MNNIQLHKIILYYILNSEIIKKNVGPFVHHYDVT